MTRLKYGPANFPAIIASGKKYTDTTFETRDMIYWFIFSETDLMMDFEIDYWMNNIKFERLSEKFPEATLWGDNPHFHDII